MFDAARIIEDNVAGLTAGSIGAGIGKLPEGVTQRRNRNTPDIRAAQNSRFFPRREFQPESIDQLFAVRVRGPGDGERREML